MGGIEERGRCFGGNLVNYDNNKKRLYILDTYMYQLRPVHTRASVQIGSG